MFDSIKLRIAQGDPLVHDVHQNKLYPLEVTFDDFKLRTIPYKWIYDAKKLLLDFVNNKIYGSSQDICYSNKLDYGVTEKSVLIIKTQDVETLKREFVSNPKNKGFYLKYNIPKIITPNVLIPVYLCIKFDCKGNPIISEDEN